MSGPYKVEAYRVGHCTDYFVVGPTFAVSVEFGDAAEDIAKRLNEQHAEIERLRQLFIDGKEAT